MAGAPLAAAVIADEKFFSVYFKSTFPPDAVSVQSVRVLVDFQGPEGKTGTLVVHVSDDRGLSRWYEVFIYKP